MKHGMEGKVWNPWELHSGEKFRMSQMDLLMMTSNSLPLGVLF